MAMMNMISAIATSSSTMVKPERRRMIVLLHIAPGLPGVYASPPASRGLYASRRRTRTAVEYVDHVFHDHERHGPRAAGRHQHDVRVAAVGRGAQRALQLQRELIVVGVLGSVHDAVEVAARHLPGLVRGCVAVAV